MEAAPPQPLAAPLLTRTAARPVIQPAECDEGPLSPTPLLSLSAEFLHWQPNYLPQLTLHPEGTQVNLVQFKPRFPGT